MNDKKNILYVGEFELPDKNAAAHRVLNNAKIFKKIGYNIIFSGIDHEKKCECQNIEGFKNYPELIHKENSISKFRRMNNIDHYIKICKENKINYIIAYNLHSTRLKKLIKYCKEKSIIIISDCTEWLSIKFTLNPIGFIKYIDGLICMKIIIKKVDGMIAISSYLEKYYKDKIKNIIVIPPLVDLQCDKYKIIDKNKNNEIKIIYAGRPCRSKESLNVIVKAINNIKYNVILDIIGLTELQFKKIYNIKCDYNKIKFYGNLSHNETLNLIKEADYSIIIRPKTRNNMAGFPTKFVESISCKTPVIANDFSDINYYLNSSNGLLIKNDLKEELEKEFAKRKKYNVNEHTFDINQWVDKFIAFFNNYS